MRKVILQLAVSLDGFIEGPNGEFDWCLTDDDYGMTDFYKRIDCIFIGRKSYEMVMAMGGAAPPGFPKLKEYVFSDTLKAVGDGDELIKGNLEKNVHKIKSDPGKDIWLYGGAALTSSFVNAGLIDEMSLAVHPVILGGGKSLFQNLSVKTDLKLADSKTYPSGLIMLSYLFLK